MGTNKSQPEIQNSQNVLNPQHGQQKSSKIVTQIRDFYLVQGYVIIPNFLSFKQCDGVITEYESLKKQSGFLRKKPDGDDKFFIDRFNKFTNFFENAYSQEIDKQSILKLGHALHVNDKFSFIPNSQKIKDINQELSIKNPIIVESMIIQKLPKKGSKVTLHQDSTYLITEPQSITGYWIPLQNVTQQNGCIWVIPRSHSQLYEQFKVVDGKSIYNHYPMEFSENDAISLKMNKGDLLILSGRLLHKSNDNLSNKTRYAFTWHSMDEQSKWNEHNWISIEQIAQYTET